MGIVGLNDLQEMGWKDLYKSTSDTRKTTIVSTTAHCPFPHDTRPYRQNNNHIKSLPESIFFKRFSWKLWL